MLNHPITPTTSALVTRVLDGYKCLVCDLVCASESQLSSHIAGKRHAQNVLFMEARGADRWRGNPNYSYFNFWNTVSDLVPVFVSGYPSIDALLSTRVGGQVSKEIDSGDISSVKGGCEVVVSERQFYSEMYQCLLPVDEFVCELCTCRIIGRFCFRAHLRSESHVQAVRGLSDIDCDYFQPVLDSETRRVFYVGLVSQTLMMYENFFSEHGSILFSQWSLIEHVPTPDSPIMQQTPQQAIDLFIHTQTSINI